MTVTPTKKYNFLTGIAILCLLATQYLLAYHTERTQFVQLLGLYSLSFIGFYLFYHIETKRNSLQWIISTGIMLRLLWIAAEPALTDDYFRYIWDGRLLVNGVNPFSYLPQALLQEPIMEQAHLTELYDGLNSKQYYSVYPTTAQFFFASGAYWFPKSIMGHLIYMRCWWIIAEVLTMLGLVQLLKQWKFPLSQLVLYAINPFIIVELTGNLHLEVWLVLGLVWMIYFLVVGRYGKAVGAWILAVGAKLLPIMLLPYFVWYLWHKSPKLFWKWSIVALVGLILWFSPFLTRLGEMGTSVGLYFASFEYNAGAYYVLRYGVHDYILGGYSHTWMFLLLIGLPLVALSGILWLSWRYRKADIRYLPLVILGAFSFYLFTTATVHPWYLSSIVAMTVLTTYRYPIIWSWGIILSYEAYRHTNFGENGIFIGIEYGVVVVVLMYELVKKSSDSASILGLNKH